MGDQRFEAAYEQVALARDRAKAIFDLQDEDVVAALGAASRRGDALLANVLATEALNRIRRLRAALAHMAESVVSLGADGRVQWANPSAEALLGWRLSDVIGSDFHTLVDHRDAAGAPVPREACLILRTATDGATHQGEGEHFRGRDGRRMCVAFTSAPIFGQDSEVAGIVVVFRDCEDHVRKDKEIAEGRERYKSLFDSLDIPIISIGLNGEILEANAAAVELTGRPIEETRGHSFGEFIEPEDREAVLRLFGDVVAGERMDTSFRVLHKDGRALRVQARGIPIIIDGQVVGIHGIVRRD